MSKYAPPSILTEELLDRIIERTQASIEAMVERQLLIEPDLEKAKAAFEEAVKNLRGEYNRLQGIWDEQQAVIDKEHADLQVLLRQKSMGGFKPEDSFDEERPERGAKQRRRKPSHRVMWVEKIREQLKQIGKFSDLQFMIEKVIVTDPDARKANLSLKDKQKAEYYIKRLAQDMRQGVAWENNKIGLVDWTNYELDSQGYVKGKVTVKPEYL